VQQGVQQGEQQGVQQDVQHGSQHECRQQEWRPQQPEVKVIRARAAATKK